MKVFGFLAMGLALSLGIAGGVHAAGSVSTRIENVDAVDFPRIQATVQVFSDQGRELSSDDFRVAEDGMPVDGFEIRVDPRPVYLVLVLDESGSMKPSLAHLKKAAFEFLDVLDDRVRTQLLTFSDTVRSRTGFLEDTRLVKRRVAEVSAQGGTRLYDAVDLAARNLGPYPQDVRRVVVAFTDGRDGKAGKKGRLSEVSAKGVAKYARSHGVPLYFLGLGKGVNRKLLTKLARATGGEALFSGKTEELRAVFQRMARSLETSYRLRYTTPRPEADGKLRTLQVTSLEKGRKDQGRGQYRAPRPSKKGYSPARMARRRGFSAYRKVLASLGKLGNYGVHVDSTVTTPGVEGTAGVDLTSSLDLTHMGAVGTSMDLDLGLGMEALGVRVVRKAQDAYLELGRLDGPDLETRVDLKGRTDLAWLQNPVQDVIGWLGMAGRGKVQVKPPKDGSAYLFEAPDRIRLQGPGGESRGVLTFDRKSFLPTHLISLDPATGRSSNVRFRNWRLKGRFHIELPDAEKLSAEAQAFALRTTRMALQTAGSALRTADAAVDASVAAGKAGLAAGLAGAEAGLAGAREGMAVANASLAMVQPWTDEGVGVAVKTLGGVSRLLGSQEFQQALTAGPRAAGYWTAYAEDFDATFEKRFDASMQQFDQDLSGFLGDLDSQLEAQNEAFEKDMLAFSEKLAGDMTELGENLAEAGTELGAEIAGEATEVALDAAQAGLDAGLDAAGEATEFAGEAAEQGLEMGREGAQAGLDAARDATRRTAENIQAIGEGAGLGGLKNLGSRLKGLGQSMNQGQGAGWGDDDDDSW